MRRIATTTTALLVVLSSCGSLARSHTLWPAVKLAWPGVRADIEQQGGRMPSDAARLDAAVTADDWTMVAQVDTQAIDTIVRAAIRARLNTGEIGPAVAMSKIERLEQFISALDTLQEHLR